MGLQLPVIGLVQLQEEVVQSLQLVRSRVHLHQEGQDRLLEVRRFLRD